MGGNAAFREGAASRDEPRADFMVPVPAIDVQFRYPLNVRAHQAPLRARSARVVKR